METWIDSRLHYAHKRQKGEETRKPHTQTETETSVEHIIRGRKTIGEAESPGE